MDCFARFFFPAPTFWDTKDAMDCISELGTSIAKLTILQATPYPEEASRPSRLTKAQSARKESWVRNSCNASGKPIWRNLLHCGFSLKSLFLIVNGRSFLIRRSTANTTLSACAVTVAIAAPAASIWNPATRTISPITFTIHATSTKSSGDLLSPSPRKIADSRL